MINRDEILQAIKPFVLQWISEFRGQMVSQSSVIVAPAARGCRVINTATQSIPNTGVTALTFDTEIHDTDGGWAVGAPTKLYAQRAGYYMAGGQWAHTSNGAAYRISVNIYKNGTTTLGTGHQVTGAIAAVHYIFAVTGMFWMDVGDYIEIMAAQGSAGAVTVLGATTTNQHYCNGWLTLVQ